MTTENLHSRPLGDRGDHAFLASKHQGKYMNISIDPVTLIGLIILADKVFQSLRKLKIVFTRKE